MKIKYMTAIVLLFLGCASVVQASSIHGDYKGDPIVSVTAGGKKLLVEDMPAINREGRTMVPLYLLKQTGVDVKWEPEKYNVDLTLPDPTRAFSGDMKKLNEKAKEYGAGNVRLVYNEYGSYLQVDLKRINDSKIDRENIFALSKLLIDSPAETLVVDFIQQDEVNGKVVVQRTDAIEFHAKKLDEYDFMQKWWGSFTPIEVNKFVPNKPVKTMEPEPTDRIDTFTCEQMHSSYRTQVQKAVEAFNRGGSQNAMAFEHQMKELKDGMNARLKEAKCSLVD